MPSSYPQLQEPLPFMHTIIVTVIKRCKGLWKIIPYNTQTVQSFEKSTVTVMPSCLNSSLMRLCFNLCGDGKKKKRSAIHVDLCRRLFGHLLFSHLVLTWKSVRWREWNKDRLVCVFQSRLETWVEMAENWQMNFSATLHLLHFALFSCSASFQVM